VKQAEETGVVTITATSVTAVALTPSQLKSISDTEKPLETRIFDVKIVLPQEALKKIAETSTGIVQVQITAL